MLVGPSGVGKTSYLALMYEQMQREHAGFRLRAATRAVHDVLLVNAEAARRREILRPGPNLETVDLVLLCGAHSMLTFAMVDHPGTVLTQHRAHPGARRFQDALATADGILAFADARQLSAGHGATRQLRDIVTSVLRALMWTGARPMPVVVAVTNGEPVPPSVTGPPDEMLAPLGPFMTALRSAPDVHEMTTFVTCGPHPSGLVRPLAWSLLVAVLARNARLAAWAASIQAGAVGPTIKDPSLVHAYLPRTLHEVAHLAALQTGLLPLLWHHP